MIHLPHRRHGGERDRQAKGKDERKKSQTWSHCKNLLNRKSTRSTVTNDPASVREQSHTQIHENDSTTHPAFEACGLEWAAPRRRANPARRQVPSTHSPCAENDYAPAVLRPSRRAGGSCRRYPGKSRTVS